MKLTDDEFEDESVGIEGETSTSYPSMQHSNLHYGHKPRGSETTQQYGSYGQKPSLPRGSETFQQVLLEIQKEQEASEDTSADKLGQLKTVSEKIKDSNNNDGQRIMKGSMWKVASLKLFKRSRSQRELLKK